MCTSPSGNLLGFAKAAREGTGLKLQYLYSLVHISSAETRPSLRGFSWQTLYCKWQIYWCGVKQSQAISACTVSPAWTENKDLIVSVYLKWFIKQFFTRSWGKKNIYVLIWDFLLFLKRKKVSHGWIEYQGSIGSCPPSSCPQVGLWWASPHPVYLASPSRSCLHLSNQLWSRTCCD